MMQRNYDTHINNNSTSSHQACASCKHQRKKCNEECVLAPYFPAHKTKEFQAVHKVFGVSNVQKMVRTLKEEDRKRLADSLIWEGFWRLKDPVLGPYGEYRRICEELKLYKSCLVQPMMGWNANNLEINNNNNNKGLMGFNNNHSGNTNHNNEKLVMDSSCMDSGGYPSRYVQGLEKLKQERDNVGDGVIAVLQQQNNHSFNGYNQQYYISGQFGFVNSKSTERTIV